MIAMLSNLGGTTLSPPTPTPPPQPAVKAVESPAPSAAARHTGPQTGGFHDLVRSARAYADLLQMTRDPNVAAMFSGFGPSHAAGGIDVYA